MTREISEGRKTAYYLGAGMIGLGFILFISTFFTFNFTPAIIGMCCIILGGYLRQIGARGLAGSGTILDPSQAREDLEPYSRMVGGMAKDALDEADIHLGGKTEQVIMVKCSSCKKLNEEDSKFCQECGKPF